MNVLRVSGSAPAFPADYTTPTYNIYYKNGSFSVLVLNVPMTQGLDNVWYLTYSIPSTAGIGTYLIKYKVTIDEIDVETTEEYVVALEANPLLDGGTGSCEISETILDGVVPVASADVYVFSSTNSALVLAHALTDSAGDFTVHLNEGTYYLFINKPGFISQEKILVVNNDCTHTITDVPPATPSVGEFAITDEVESDLLVDLTGVDVTVFLTSDTTNAIEHATTDANGIFTVYLDAGNYTVLFNKAGFISETHGLTVLSDGSHTFSGN